METLYPFESRRLPLGFDDNPATNQQRSCDTHIAPSKDERSEDAGWGKQATDTQRLSRLDVASNRSRAATEITLRFDSGVGQRPNHKPQCRRADWFRSRTRSV